jgi:hypothetical protein
VLSNINEDARVFHVGTSVASIYFAFKSCRVNRCPALLPHHAYGTGWTAGFSDLALCSHQLGTAAGTAKPQGSPKRADDRSKPRQRPSLSAAATAEETDNSHVTQHSPSRFPTDGSELLLLDVLFQTSVSRDIAYKS